MKSLFAVLLCISFVSSVFCQAWLARYNGLANDEDHAWDITLDASGNVYVTGTSWGLSSAYDYATVKYNSSGVEQWITLFNGSSNGSDQSRAAIINNDQVVVTGGSSDANFYTDIATICYNSNSSVAWTAYYDDSINGNDFGLALATDNTNDLYVTGYASGTNTGWDLVTIKYNASGIQQWVKTYSTADEDYGVGAVTNSSGDVYVLGNSGDPYYFTWDYVLLKYNSSTGDTLWTRRYNGPADEHDEARAIAIDNNGNVCVTGGSTGINTSTDFTTVKYNTNGETLWTCRYNGPSNGADWANAIAIDVDNNVYVTGYSQDLANDYDYVTVKYDASGSLQWVVRYNGPDNGYDEAKAITLDTDANVYVTGLSTGVGSFTDYATIKYNSSGALQWVHRYNGPANNQDQACAIAYDSTGYICITGTSNGVTTGSDYATLKLGLNAITQETENYKLKINNLYIFPNPAKSIVHVQSPLNIFEYSLRIYDITGQQVKQYNNLSTHQTTINLDQIKSGIYFVVYQDHQNQSKTEKLIIQK